MAIYKQLHIMCNKWHGHIYTYLCDNDVTLYQLLLKIWKASYANSQLKDSTISGTPETKGIYVQALKVVYNLEAPGITVLSRNLDNRHDL